MNNKLKIIDIKDAEYITYCYQCRSMVMANLTNEELDMANLFGAKCKDCNINMEIIGWQAYCK
jgi:hypothetical protein